MKVLQQLSDRFQKSRQLRQMGLLARVRNILRKPQHFLVIVAFENATFLSVGLHYLMILAIIPAVCGFIGMQAFGVDGLFYPSPVPFLFALLMSIVCYVLTLAMIVLFALAINMVSIRFEGQGDWLAAFKLAAYAATPALLGGVFGLIPALSILNLGAALYGARLVKMGLPILMKVPHNKIEACAKYLFPVTLLAGASMFFCLTLSSSLFGHSTTQLSRDSEAYIELETYQRPEIPSPSPTRPKQEPPQEVLQRIHHPPLSPDMLKIFLPARLGPFVRTTLQDSSLAGETPVSVSLANYDDGGHQKLVVTIVDTGNKLNDSLPPDQETDSAIKKSWRAHGRIHHLTYDKLGAHAEYKIILRSGTTVTLEGTRISSDLLKMLASEMNLAGLENQSRL